MKNKQKTLRLVAVAFLFGMAAFATSCKKDSDPISGEVSATVKNEATQDSQQDEVDDMSTIQLNKADDTGSRMLTDDDARVACAYVHFELGTEKLSGTLVIDFDKTPDGQSENPNGCTDARGNVRKGKITITWAGGRWFHVGSVITITLTNYSINGVVINGTRVLTNITTNILLPTWTIVSELNVTWPDASTASRTVHKTRQWDILGGTVTVTQTAGADAAASGTTRRGVEYSVQITEGLVFKFSCQGTSKVYIPVSGIKVITFKSKVVTVDFGSGTCDNTFTVTIDGKSDSFAADNSSEN